MTHRWGNAALGWMLSAGIHLVLILGAALVFVEQLAAFDNDYLICCFHEPKPVVPPDVPRDLVERKGTLSGEGQRFDPFEESTFSPDSLETWLPGSDLIPIDDRSGRRSSSPLTLQGSGERPRRNSEDRGRILGPGGRGGLPSGPP